MKLENTRLIRAEPEVVWDNLVSVDILKQCIPGCQSMDETGENEYALVMKSKVGPVSATFKGDLNLRDIQPGESYTLEFKGSGGAAGFASGSADVRLERAEGGTNLVYSVDARIGGKIAQVGQRLVDGTARKMADDFFNNFEQAVAPGSDAGESDESDESGDGGQTESLAGQSTASSAAGRSTESAPSGSSTSLWVGGGIALLMLIIVWAMF